MLSLNVSQRDAMLAACIRALPNEGCGLLLGTGEGLVREVITSPNIADSAKLYEIEPSVLLRASRRADAEGLEVMGVFHSHTHSEAYPSPTDVRQAPDPTWHYVLISLADSPADLQSFRIIDGDVAPEVVVVTE
jgi:proteasome lid subunit RPN8/RPN11